MQKKGLIVLTGPTAVGKTELSIELAKRINGQIISADSIQVYRHMDIGSAKIKPEEMQGIKHHLIDILEPDEPFDVARFKSCAKEAISQIHAEGAIPIIAGGTGFYIQAVLKDIDFTENEDDGYREYLNDIYKKEGSRKLIDMLMEVDPESLNSIHPNNIKRVIRALEYNHQTGEKISVHNERESAKESPYNYAYFVLNMDREKLYKRIDRRVDIMIEEGLCDEVKELIQKYNLEKNMTSMQGLGYKEFLSYINNEISYEDAVYTLKRDTRHFAKRQLTWFKREKDVYMVDKDELTTTNLQLEYILRVLREKGIYND